MGDDGNDRKSDGKPKSESANLPANDNKVVPFPTHKIRKPKANGDAPNVVTGGPDSRSGLSENRKKTLVVSLLSTMLVATFMASRVNKNRDVVRIDTDQNRNLASVAQQAQRRELDEDLMLAKKIARQSLREPASGGREPTAQELLSHGELASAYAIQYDKDGALRQIEFALQAGGQPRRVTDPAQFLMNHKDLFRLDFDSVKKTESIRDNESLTEDYDLAVRGEAVAKVYFKFKNNYELHLMKVELSDESRRNPANSK